MKRIPTPAAPSFTEAVARPTSRLVRSGPAPMALEQRFMFDGAAVGDAVETLADKPVTTDVIRLADTATVPQALVTAEAEAERLLAEFLQRPDAREQLFALFNGGQSGSEPSAAWQAAFEQLLASQGEPSVKVELRGHAELHGAKGAYSSTGTTGEATIYLNADWLATADSASVTKVLVEELGHHLDASLNGGADTAGDEGEIFSRFIIDSANPLSVTYLASQDDHATVQIDGQAVQVELASFNFVNAYGMVYDLNNNNDIVGSTGETAAEKEQSSHNFDITSLGAARVDDNTNSNLFSGNDVSATGINIGGNTYYGWISRPIKSGGIVRGFYFWTDPQFTNFAAAQNDGNQDGDSNAKDNKGFLLVVDQAWFDQQIAAKRTTVTLNNIYDGNRGSVTYSTVGSSSDRVDSALNSLLVFDLVNVSDVTVNEGSPYATFTVSGLANQQVTLSLQNQNADGSTLSTLQYFDGVNWQPYNGGVVSLNGSGSLLVRVALSPEQETTLDGPETFNLVATNTAGLASTGGTGTIVDDGTGSYFAANNNTAASALPAGTLLDDDRPLTVNDVNVNEGSPYAVFEVTGASSQTALLSLTGSSGDPLIDPINGAAGLGTTAPTLQYLEGGVWKNYDASNPPKIAAGTTKLYVRVAISAEQEMALDGPETFSLVATNTGGTADTGIATIKDDGTGDYWLNNSPTSATGTELSNAGIKLDDDRPVTITSPTVNEASPYAVFTVDGELGQLVTLNLSSGSALGNADYQTKVEYFDGANWMLYTGGYVPLNGPNGTLLVRVPVINDSTQEPDETFTLTAMNTGGSSVVGTATIQDDGNGTIYNADGSENTTAIKDDDRALIVSSPTANEEAGEIIFDVTGKEGQLVILALANTTNASGNATVGIDTGSTLTFISVDGGTSWISYSPDANGYITLPLVGGLDNGESFTLKVKTTLTRDSLTETNETFSLTATNTGGSTAKGVGTIVDNLAPTAVADTNSAREQGTADTSVLNGSLGGSSGSPAAGNVLTDGTDDSAGVGESPKVVSAANPAYSATSTPVLSDGIDVTVTGVYGTLTINKNGAYTYAVTNGNLAVQALRLSTDTLTDTFTYTIDDGYGGQATTTLAITIQGANDQPDAIPDYNIAKESIEAVVADQYGSTDATGQKAIGNVLPNDTDYDGGDTKVIVGLSGQAVVNNASTAVDLVFVPGTTFSPVGNGDEAWLWVDSNGNGTKDNGEWKALAADSAGSTRITATGPFDGTSIPLNFSPTYYWSGTGWTQLASLNGKTIGFTNNDDYTVKIENNSGMKDGVVSQAAAPATNVITISGPSGTVAKGMTVTGDGVTGTVTVDSVTYDSGGNTTSITLSANITSANGTVLSFTAAAGITVTGRYGTLVFDANGLGGYTYTPFANNSNISEGQSVTETFTYQMQDTLLSKDSSQLIITVLGSGTNDANAKTDSNYTVENTTGTATGNVLTSNSHNYNLDIYADVADSSGGGVAPIYVVGAKAPSSATEDTSLYVTTQANGATSSSTTLEVDSGTDISIGMIVKSAGNISTAGTSVTVTAISGTTITLSSPVSVSDNAYILFVKPASAGIVLHGLYGDLTLHSDGSYSYLLNDASPTVNALTSGQTLSDTFNYRISNGYFSTGANGSPAGLLLTDVASLNIAIYGTNDAPVLDLDTSTGSTNFANTFTEGGSAVSLLNQTGVNLSDVDSTTFDNLILSFDMDNFPDTTNERVVFANASVGGSIILSDLIDGGTGTLTLTLNSVNYVYDYSVSVDATTHVKTLTFTIVGGGEMSTADTERLLDALRYQNTSDNPTARSDRVFTLSVTDGAALVSAPVTSTITVIPVNDAPTLDLDGDNSSIATGTNYLGSFTVGGTASAIADTDSLITDTDSDNLSSATITLTNAKVGDILSFNGALPSNIEITGLNTRVTIDGSLVVTLTTKSGQTAIKTDYEAAIEAIRFATTGTNYSDRVFNVTVFDDSVAINGATGLPTSTPSTLSPLASNTAVATLTIQPDNRPLTVYGTTVNEASPYVVFKVVNDGTGEPNQLITLALSNSGSAQPGVDTANAGVDVPLQYFNGATWERYVPGTTVALDGFELYVRTALVNDQAFEGPETLNLVASNAAGSSSNGNSTIKDDGTGDVFLADTPPTATLDPAGPSDTGYPAVLDDDRQLTVSSVTVNEGSPYAVFEVSGIEGQKATLQLAGQNLDGADLSGLEWFNGTGWEPYTTGVTLPQNGPSLDGEISKLYVRVAISTSPEQERALDGPETFQLIATNTGGTSGVGIGTILDDGRGSYWIGDARTPASGTDLTTAGIQLDDDRPITISSPTVNEASPFAIFTVDGEPGQLVTLTAAPGTADAGIDYRNQIEYSTDGGRTWTPYPGGYVPLDGPDGTVMVRLPVVNDDNLERSETFTLTASTTGQVSATGTATIVDEGNGTIYNPNGTVNTLATKDDDRPITVVGGNYNENAGSAVFTVDANPGQWLTLNVVDQASAGKAPTGDNEGNPDDSLDTAPIYYSIDGGATWQRYTRPFQAGAVDVLVAVDVTAESDNVFEGEEQFKLIVNEGQPTESSGYSSLFDDGSGIVTNPINDTTTNYTGADNGQRKDDDRPVPAAPPAPAPAPAPSLAPPPAPAEVPLASLPPFNSATVLQVTSPRPQLEIGTFPVEAILTSDAGFPVLVLDPGNPSLPPNLMLANAVADQFAEPGKTSSFALPFDTFAHTKADAQVTLTAKQQDGSDLPNWVVFDPQTGTFTVKPPADLPESLRELKLMVIARDQEGREATAPFRFFVGEDKSKAKDKVVSRLSLSEKLKLAGKRDAAVWAEWTRQPVEAKPAERAKAPERAVAHAG